MIGWHRQTAAANARLLDGNDLSLFHTMQPLYEHSLRLSRSPSFPVISRLSCVSAPANHALNPRLARAFQQRCRYWNRPSAEWQTAGKLSDTSPRSRPSITYGHAKGKTLCLRNASTSGTQDLPPLPPKDGSTQRELPSQSEHRRSPLSKRASHLMDNLQSNIFIAGQRLNDLTGYSGIEALKQDIENQGMSPKSLNRH